MLKVVQSLRLILSHALGKIILFSIGIIVSAGNVLYILGLDTLSLREFIGAAQRKQLLGDILFAFVPLLTISVIGVLGHLITYRTLISDWFGWFLIIITGYLLFKFFEITALWRECTLGPLDGERLLYTEGAVIRVLIALLVTEVLLSVHGAWVSRR